MTETIKILDHGFIRLDAAMADDLSVVNSARVSFGKRKEKFEEEDAGLIKYLIKNRHGTPFEHNAFRFHVKAPIFIFREWQRHRIGSFNEMSARYMQLPAEWYIPIHGMVRTRVGKPGHYTYEAVGDEQADAFISELTDQCEYSYRCYQASLEEGIAPEQARMFLHVNHYSEMYWTVNCRSVMNFVNLRNAETAQWEIRKYAEVIEMLVDRCMPFTMEAFRLNGRIAP